MTTASAKKRILSDGARKPAPMRVDAAGIPDVLRPLTRYVGWLWTWDPKKCKWDKPPKIVGTSRNASSTNPRTWGDLGGALDANHQGAADGIGIVLGEVPEMGGAILAGVDLDDAIDTATGALHEWADGLRRRLGTYGELSPTGTGAKFLGTLRPGTVLTGRHKFPVKRGGEIEMYHGGRYFTLTGNLLPDCPRGVRDITDAYLAVHAELSARRDRHEAAGEAPRQENATDQGAAGFDDEELLRRAARFSNGDKFRRLWDGNTSDYDGDHSRADAALCCMIAFLVGKDAARVDRLFRRSGLMREKWDVVHYGDGRTDTGMWRRLRLVPFNVTFWDPDDPATAQMCDMEEELRQDKHLGDKLRGEAPGILRWLVDGCLDWQRHGLTLPKKVQCATDEYREAEDLLRQFIADCCLTGTGPNYRVRRSALYAAYSKWCQDRGEEPARDRSFGEQMTRRGFERTTSNGVWYVGIAIRPRREDGQ
jgi:hypothetical protein